MSSTHLKITPNDRERAVRKLARHTIKSWDHLTDAELEDAFKRQLSTSRRTVDVVIDALREDAA